MVNKLIQSGLSYPILAQCSIISIPPENVRTPKVSWHFQGVGIEMEPWTEISLELAIIESFYKGFWELNFLKMCRYI